MLQFVIKNESRQPLGAGALLPSMAAAHIFLPEPGAVLSLPPAVTIAPFHGGYKRTGCTRFSLPRQLIARGGVWSLLCIPRGLTARWQQTLLSPGARPAILVRCPDCRLLVFPGRCWWPTALLTYASLCCCSIFHALALLSLLCGCRYCCCPLSQRSPFDFICLCRRGIKRLERPWRQGCGSSGGDRVADWADLARQNRNVITES